MPKTLGVICPKGKVTWDECHTCSLGLIRPCGLPPEALADLHNHEDTEPDALTHSPSRLMACQRRAILMSEEYESWVNVEFAYASLRGTLVHRGMESAPIVQQSIREERLSTTVETEYGVETFTAKSDNIVVRSIEETKKGRKKWHVAHVLIRDTKTTDVTHDLVSADTKHAMQLNLYAWIVRRELPKVLNVDEVVVDALELNYFGQSKPRTFTSAGWGSAKGKKPRGATEAETLELAPIPLLPQDKLDVLVTRLVTRRVKALQARKESGALPPVLQGDDAKWCFRCPVWNRCQSIG